MGPTTSQGCASRKGEETPFHAAGKLHLSHPHLCCRSVVDGWFPFLRGHVDLACASGPQGKFLSSTQCRKIPTEVENKNFMTWDLNTQVL